MHEAGLAESIAASVRHLDLEGSLIRIVVSGGHQHGDASREALAAYVGARLAGSGASVEVLEEAAPRLCSVCAIAFAYLDEGDSCPSCGGQPMPPSLDEEAVSVQVIDPKPPGGN